MEKKKTILIDISDIIDCFPKKEGNGIFFCAYNILKEILGRNYINMVLYCDSKHISSLYDSNDDSLIQNCRVIKSSDINKIENLIGKYEFLKIKNRENREGIIKYLFIKIVLFLLKSFKKCYLKKLNYEEFFKDIDFYLSLVGAVPDEIRTVSHIKKCNIIHDVIPLILPEYRKGFKKSPFYRLFKTINNKDLYFANSEYTKKDFIKYLPKINSKNITVIPLSAGDNYKPIKDSNAINNIKAKYSIPIDKTYIFSLCTLEPRKNLIFSIKNYIKFIEQNNIKDLVYVLGGKAWNDFEDILRKEIPDIEKYSENIIKTGFVKTEDMAALFSGARMFIYPSLYEGFGMPILESMKCGCPVICSNVTSMPEVIGDCGMTINPTSDKELIFAIKKMYYSEDFRNECSKKGLERAKFFTWERCVDIILDKLEVRNA